MLCLVEHSILWLFVRSTQINLVDWLKQMVGNRRSEEVADPAMAVKPTSRALKRALLVALRCVDPDALKRPKMGHVVHMLEAEEFPFRDVCDVNQSDYQSLNVPRFLHEKLILTRRQHISWTLEVIIHVVFVLM